MRRRTWLVALTRMTFLSRIAEALEFPDWFGRNWDAFFDCLTDLSWLPAGGHVLVLLNTAEMRRDAPEALRYCDIHHARSRSGLAEARRDRCA